MHACMASLNVSYMTLFTCLQAGPFLAKRKELYGAEPLIYGGLNYL